MNDWNPFGKIDTEIGSFLKESVFNKEYSYEVNEGNESSENNEENDNSQNNKKQ